MENTKTEFAYEVNSIKVEGDTPKEFIDNYITELLKQNKNSSTLVNPEGLVANVNGVKVQGKTNKELTINYLTELVNQNKSLSNTERLLNYIEYFCDNFSYNKQHREDVLSGRVEDSFQQNEKDLSKLFTSGHGVCQQLSQGLSLLSVIDRSITGDGILIPYTNLRVSAVVNEDGKEVVKKMGHAINVFQLKDMTAVIDISSMLHAKEGDFNQDKYNFGMVLLPNYIKNLKKEKEEIIPIADSEENTYMANYTINLDVDTYYNMLNLTPEDMMNLDKATRKVGIGPLLQKIDVSNQETRGE